MPAIIDHEERRTEVASIAAGLVADNGADAVTFRDVAKAAGFSTSVVSHYFENKQELLNFMFEGAARRGVERLKAAVSAGAPMEECVASILPLDEDRRRDWHVVLAFWGRAQNDAELLKRQRVRNREMLAWIRKLLVANGAYHAGNRVQDTRARTILTIIMGLAIQALFDPKTWTPEKQRAVIADVLSGQD